MALRRHEARLPQQRHRRGRNPRGLGGRVAGPVHQPHDTFDAESLHHFCIAVDDLDTTVTELRRRGVNFLGEPFVVEQIGRRLVFLTDNAGNMIELSAPLGDA
jgi:catechol 2,3-dioxygenase-like lactoylglutathione lyase family enzyme